MISGNQEADGGSMSKVNRNFKASVFTHLFGEPKNELDLYNAFSPIQFPPDTPVIDLTLTDALYMGRVNDLSFSIGGKLLIFFEHQASLSENMPLRFFIYCGRVYEKIIDNSVMYSEQRVKIPSPEFYVLYNGIKPFPERKVCRLSESYERPDGGEAPLELVVTVYNVNKGFNSDIISRSNNLYGYVTLVSKTREFESLGMERQEAVEAAINGCIREGILAEYLKNNASEVSNMLLQEWNWEDAKTVWQREAKEISDREWKPIVAQKDNVIAQKDKDNARLVADKDAEIADLRAQLEMKKSNN